MFFSAVRCQVLPLCPRRRRVLRMGDSAAPVSARLRCEHRGQPLQAHLRPAAGLGHPDAHCVRTPAGEEVELPGNLRHDMT